MQQGEQGRTAYKYLSIRLDYKSDVCLRVVFWSMKLRVEILPSPFMLIDNNETSLKMDISSNNLKSLRRLNLRAERSYSWEKIGYLLQETAEESQSKYEAVYGKEWTTVEYLTLVGHTDGPIIGRSIPECDAQLKYLNNIVYYSENWSIEIERYLQKGITLGIPLNELAFTLQRGVVECTNRLICIGITNAFSDNISWSSTEYDEALLNLIHQGFYDRQISFDLRLNFNFCASRIKELKTKLGEQPGGLGMI